MSELILVGGFPASGKTTVTNHYVQKGYVRLNRDLVGGKVDDLLPALQVALASGKNVVMDNLYCTKASRQGAIAVAGKLGVKSVFVLMDTSLEDAQFNACNRMMEQAGHILHPEEHKLPPYRDNPNLFPVAVLYKYRKEFEKPTLSEGFSEVKTEKFVRKYPSDWVNKAVICDFDGTLRTHEGDEKYPTKPEQVKAFVNRKDKLIEWAEKGYILLGASNQSGVGKGILTDVDAIACFDETLKQLGLHKSRPAPGPRNRPQGYYFEEVLYCPHKVPPITCYCRKPGPGMGVELIHKYKLDPRQCFYVGDMTTDKSFAGRCGFKFVDHNDFFA